MFGVLGYGYEYLTGSDLGSDIQDAGSAALETAGDIYDYTASTAQSGLDYLDEQSGFKGARQTAADTVRASQDTAANIAETAEKTAKAVQYAAIGALGLLVAGFAVFLGTKK